jgi:phage shock protein C
VQADTPQAASRAVTANPEPAPGPVAEGRDVLPHEQRRARRPASGGPLRRSRTGRRLGGVSAGIARFVGKDVRAVRALWALSVAPSLGITIVGYVALWFLLPLEPAAGAPPSVAEDD